MRKITDAITEIYRINVESERKVWINKIHPLAKLFLTIIYIEAVVSFNKYDLKGICVMALYPFITMIFSNISIKDCVYRLKPIFIVVCAVGIVNPFMDYKVIGEFFGINITGGVISMMTLMVKGILAVLATYILIITTSIEKVCYALRILHIPKIFISVILIIHRYIVLLLKEAEKITNAYELRAPGQKGINFKAWGSLAGMLMLRSLDRSQEVYESMLLRGYNGEYYVEIERGYIIPSCIYFSAWTVVILLARIIPIF